MPTTIPIAKRIEEFIQARASGTVLGAAFSGITDYIDRLPEDQVTPLHTWIIKHITGNFFEFSEPAPNWGNTHADDCPLTEGRLELWAEFCQALHVDSRGFNETAQAFNPPTESMNLRDELWGCVIEYTAGGDEDVEQCECSTHRTDAEITLIANYRRAHDNA